MRVGPIVLLIRVAASLIIVAAITFTCLHVIPVNALTAGFAFLLGVLGIAATWGLIESIAASVAAMLCFNYYFLPPVGMFTIADPQNWVALFTFLVTALVASHLSDREKKQAGEALKKQRETEQLYALSRAILLTDPSQSVGSQAARHISEIFECPAVALYDAKTADIFRGGADDLPDIEAKLKQVAVQGNIFAGPPLFIAAILLGGQPIGSLALKGSSLSDGALQALLNLVAIALERVRTEEAANRADAARQSEEFKSTLLDAIAHEFKTPLTSIKAASTSMLSDSLAPPLRELAAIIDEETDRMNQLVTEAVRMSQIDAGKIRLERQLIDVPQLLNRVVEHFESQAAGRALKVNPGANLPPIFADPELIALALRQLVDNALKYSPPKTPIDVVADLEGERVVIRVHDRGPGIPERERERIFDKFYRRASAPGSRASVPGTGLGLYIAREILRTHGGDLWIESEPGEGSEFCAALLLPKETRTK
jgi:two-component system sensor histidine kinase KdpD